MTFYTHTNPKARTAHRCEMCGRLIGPGETYRRGAGMDGGRAWTWKECAHCALFVSVAYGRSWCDDGYNEDLFGEFEPNDIPEARVRAQWLRKWRRRDGTLYPLPVVTWAEDRYGFGWPVTIAPGSEVTS